MTDHEEHLLAVKIIRMILQEGVSFGRASRILEEAQEELRKVPLTEL